MRILILGVLLLTVTVPLAADDTFQKAKLSVQQGEKTKQIDAVVRFTADAFQVLDKKTQQPVRAFPYASVKGAEYSYAKSPRWKTALFVSPLFLFTSGKKHWLLVQGPDEYALLQLDKENYRLVLGAFESKTGKTVETVTDTK